MSNETTFQNFSFGFSATEASRKAQVKLDELEKIRVEEQKQMELEKKQDEEKKAIKNLELIFKEIEKQSNAGKKIAKIYHELHPIEEQYLKQKEFIIREEYRISDMDYESGAHFHYTEIKWQ